MKTELTKLNHSEFGLDEKQAKSVENAFLPMISEREILCKMHDRIIKEEITPELCKQAKSVRNKLVKVRTGIAEIHKSQKAFFLAAGRFVDAWKNKETLPVIQMEDNLKNIEEYYTRIEQERITKLSKAREFELKKYEVSFIPSNLGNYEDEVWYNILLGAKTVYEQKKEAEKQAEHARLENERLTKLENEREKKALEYKQFWLKENYDFRNISEESFNEIIDSCKHRKLKYESEQERIRKENERLEKEAKERKKKAEAERKAREEKERKEREVYEAKLKAEREEKERIQKELEAKAEAERKAREAEEERIQYELNKGDSGKIKDLIRDLNNLKSRYIFKSRKNQKMYSDVSILLDKIIAHINK